MSYITMVNERCGRCGTSLTGWIPKYYAIDVPFAECPECRAINNRSDKATEWKLMSRSRKTAMCMLFSYWGFAYSVVAWIFIFWIAMKWEPSIGNETKFSLSVALTFVLSLAVGMGTSFLLLLHKIGKSHARLSDAEYREKLAKLGISL